MRGKMSVDVNYVVHPDGKLTDKNKRVLNFGDKLEGSTCRRTAFGKIEAKDHGCTASACTRFEPGFHKAIKDLHKSAKICASRF